MKASAIALPELMVANHALSDRSMLDRLWQENGYLFFRDVLDGHAVNRARGRVLDILSELGVVDRASDDAQWNGNDISGFPEKVEALYRAGIWQELVSAPPIRNFFEELAGGDIAWVPLSGFRTTAPGQGNWHDPFSSRHQDGFMNGSMPFRTCWIPLDEISRDTGGLALAQGQHNRGYLHDRENAPRYPIPADAIPADAWHSAEYRPGDVVIFGIHTPHSGLPNCSDRFRLSIDVRFMRARDPTSLTVGKVMSIEPNGVVIAGADGVRRLAFDNDTYFRANSGARLTYTEALPFLSGASEVMAVDQAGVTTMIKPVQ